MGLLRCLDLLPSCTEYQRVIRVAFVIPTLDQSGAERQLTMLASALPKDEYEVQVIALNRGGPYADQLLASGIKVEVLGKRFRFDPLTYMRLRTALHRFQPQIIQSFLFAANSYVRLPEWLQLDAGSLCPNVASIHGRVGGNSGSIDVWWREPPR